MAPGLLIVLCKVGCPLAVLDFGTPGTLLLILLAASRLPELTDPDRMCMSGVEFFLPLEAVEVLLGGATGPPTPSPLGGSGGRVFFSVGSAFKRQTVKYHEHC